MISLNGFVPYRSTPFSDRYFGRRLLPLLAMVACCVGLAVPKNAVAQASPYVPIMDVRYSYLDALVAIGLVEVPSLVQRPYSRLVFGRLTKQARINLDSSPDTEGRFREALVSLEK